LGLAVADCIIGVVVIIVVRVVGFGQAVEGIVDVVDGDGSLWRRCVKEERIMIYDKVTVIITDDSHLNTSLESDLNCIRFGSFFGRKSANEFRICVVRLLLSKCI